MPLTLILDKSPFVLVVKQVSLRRRHTKNNDESFRKCMRFVLSFFLRELPKGVLTMKRIRASASKDGPFYAAQATVH